MELNTTPQKKTMGQKLKYFFVRPVELFRDYKEKPAWGLNFIIIGLVTGIFTYLSRYVAKDAYTELFNSQLAKLSPEQAAAAQGSMALFDTPLMNAVTAAISVVYIFILLLVLSLIYFGLIKLFKGKVKFKQVFAVYNLSYLVICIGLVLKLLYTYLTHKMTYFNLQPNYTDALFNNLDIFILWQSILLVFGFSTVAEIDEKRSTAVVVLVWLGTLAVSLLAVMLKK